MRNVIIKMWKFLFIAIVIVFGMSMFPCFAEDMDEDSESYSDGNVSVRYKKNESGGVTITGFEDIYPTMIVPAYIQGLPVTEIGSYCFGDLGMMAADVVKSITLPDTLIKIDRLAFSECQNLQEISLSDSLTSIGDYAFNDCSSLKTINIPDSLTSIGDYAFNGCTSLETINIPDSVTSIGSGAFYGCNHLNTIEIPDSVTSIGGGAFSGCNHLKMIEIPDSVASIGAGTFSDCAALQSVSICEGVTTLGSYVFSDCPNLESVSLPTSLTTIEAHAFSNCQNLKSLTLSKNVKNIGECAFGYYLDGADWAVCKDATIYGYANSSAELWARQNGVRFVNIEAGTVKNLRAVSAGENKVRLTWNTDTTIAKPDGYLIYAQKNGKYGYVGMTSGTTFTDTKAIRDDYNYYWVFAYVKDGNNKMYTAASPRYVYAKGICPAVTNLKAMSMTGGVRLTWNASLGAEGYLVYGYHGSPRSGAKYGYIGMTSGTTFTDKKAVKDDWNFYFVYPYSKDASGKMIVGGTAKYVYGKAL